MYIFVCLHIILKYIFVYDRQLHAFCSSDFQPSDTRKPENEGEILGTTKVEIHPQFISINIFLAFNYNFLNFIFLI